MKRNISAWKIMAMPDDEFGLQQELQAMLTLGSATVTRMRTVILWWAAPDTKQFVDSSTRSAGGH